MLGIPTLQLDYSNDPAAFDVRKAISDPEYVGYFEYRPDGDRDGNLYRLKRAMVRAYRARKVPVSIADEIARRSADGLLLELEYPLDAPPPGQGLVAKTSLEPVTS